MIYVINEDATVTSADSPVGVERPWFVSLTAAAVHGAAPMTCFTKEGIRREGFLNPMPDPDFTSPDTTPDRHNYFVQFLDGVVHYPPLNPVEAANTPVRTHEEPIRTFDFEAENIVPAI